MAKDKLEHFKPQARNANKHTPRGMGVLEKSIQADGWIGAITVAADGETFDGSARIEVGVATGFEDAIVVQSDGRRPIVHIRTDIPTADDPRAKRLGLAANRVAELNLDWDIDELLASVADGVDLSALFREDELDALLQAAHGQDEAASGEDKGPQSDRADALKEQYGTKLGQVWQLGEHRLAVGDCTDRATVEAVMRGEKAGAVVTDPPYGMKLETTRRHGADSPTVVRNKKNYHPIAGDGADFDRRAVSIEADQEFWFGADYYVDTLPQSGKDGSWLVWDKRAEGGNDTIHGSMFELIWSKKRHRREILRFVWSGVLGHVKVLDGGEKYHPTLKPAKLIMHIIEQWCGDCICDPFVGSGTTLIACEKLNRKCRAIELDPGYAAVSIHRWVEMTGKEPRLIT